VSHAALRILSAGPGVTVQDGGRHGFLRFGVTESGPMDKLSHATANRAVGVAADSAAIEVSLAGVELTSEGTPLTVAVVGGSFDVRLDGEKLPPACLTLVRVDQKLSVKAGDSGAWCYIAAAGRFDLQPTLGSVAKHTRSAIGGKNLEAGDLIGVIASAPTVRTSAEIVVPFPERGCEEIRVILGPQNDSFDDEQIALFLNSTWTLSNRSDRMGYLLEGPQLTHAKGFNIVSDATVTGSIQVPGGGQPIVLMADRPPTGGYPKIASVIGADLARLAQLRPAQKVRFEVASIEDAVRARRYQKVLLASPISFRRLPDFQPDILLGNNLVDGVTDGSIESAESEGNASASGHDPRLAR
jgi:biotin-dependent carboxylase-like uncharacterized protein